MRGKSLLVVLCLIMAPAVGLCQVTAGSIAGTVTDPSGAAIPGAAVTVTNTGTGANFQTSTNSAGTYVVTPLSVGLYSVAVTKAGFSKAVRSGITVNVEAVVRADFALQIGSTTQTVTVQSSAPLLQTGTSSLGHVVGSRSIDNLPLNGRFITRLAVLSAGVLPTTYGAPDNSTGGFSANGVRPYENDYILDGTDNTNMQSGLTSRATYVIGPPPDAIAEFKISTNSMSAQFGRSAGGVMNVTIKSGTNHLHGTAYEFLRNSALDAKNFFDAADQPIPPYRLNQFGFSLGGPVVIPHVYNGKNKTFFFGDYQGTRIRMGETLFAAVPPATWRNGDFSGFYPIYDPSTTTVVNGVATRQQFPGNQIPPSDINPIAQNLINELPLPNVPGNVSPAGVSNNYESSPSEKDDTNQFDIKGDEHISERDRLTGRFSQQNETLFIPAPLPAPLGGTGYTTGNTLTHAHSANISETHIFGPRTINEFRVAYVYDSSQLLQLNSDTNLSSQIGIPGIPFGPSNGGLPAFFISGLSGFGSPLYEPTVENQKDFQLIDTVSLIRGQHSLKMGIQARPVVNFSFLQPGSPRGRFNFSGDFTKDPNNLATTGLGAAQFLLGTPSGSQLSSFTNDVFQQPGWALFVEDNFKVTRKLTLNLGLRHDYVRVASEKNNAISSFNLATRQLDIASGNNTPMPANWNPLIPVNRNAPRSLVPNKWLNFAPRVGFAYNILPKMVIRAGYGIFWSSWEPGPLSNPNPGLNPPFYSNANFPEESIITPNPIVSSLSTGFPADALTNPVTPSLFALDPNFRDPYVQGWNFTVQRQLGRNTSFQIAYAGSKGTALYEFRNANQAAPTTDAASPINSRRPLPYLGTGLTLWCSCGMSVYHSLEAELHKQWSNGLSFLAGYTYGKAIDERSQASFGIGSGGGFRDSTRHPGWERGNAAYDVRHRFVVSYMYNLPVGRGKRFGRNMDHFSDAVLGGWELMGIDSFQTGFPYTIGGPGVSNSDGASRPDVVLGTSIVPANQGPSQWFNPAHFQTAAPGTFGNSGRNILEGPHQVNIDFSLFKNIPITDRATLQFRSEFFNILNHPNFQGNHMNRSFNSAGAGQITGANPPRQIQFALKVIF